MSKFSLYEKLVDTIQLTTNQKAVIAKIVAAATPKVAAEDVSHNPNIVEARKMLEKHGFITFREGVLAALTASGKKIAIDSDIIDATGGLTVEGNKLVGNKEEAPTTMESYKFIKQLVEAQKMSEVVEPIKSVILKIFPDSYVSVRHDTNIMDSVTVRFTVEPADQWPNKIFHNATYVIMHIDEKGKRRETGEGPYEVEVNSIHIPGIKFRKKTGSLDQITDHIRKFFTSVKETIK